MQTKSSRLFLLSLIVLLGLTHVVADEPASAEPAADWTAVREEAERAEYRFSFQHGRLQAPNRAHGLRTWVDAGGIEVQERQSDARGGPGLSFSLTQLMRGGRSLEVAPGLVAQHEERAEIRRRGLTEWFVNDPQGLKHGIDIPAPPVAGEGALVIRYRLGGEVLVYPAGPDAVMFKTAQGAPWMIYRDLVVLDAIGSVVPSTMRPGPGVLDIIIHDDDAVYPLIVDPLLSNASWSFEGNQASAYVGAVTSTAGDVNGDGYSDVLVSAYGFDGGHSNEGRVWVYYGSASGPSGAPVVLESNQTGAQFGYSVGAAGDINKDGYDDFLVGANLYDTAVTNVGAAYVYLGAAGGPYLKTIIAGDQASSEFGRAVGTAGDVNQDGYDDIVVTAFRYKNGQTNEGRAYVYHGSSGGVSATPNWTAEGNQTGAFFGTSAGTAGDTNGDGYADLIVGAYLFDNGQTDEGGAFVYLGGPTGLNTSAAWTQDGDWPGGRFGFAVSTAGDVNGDGYADVVVGAYLTDFSLDNEGAAYVYLGGSGGPSLSRHVSWYGGQVGANLGRSVFTAGDVNGDGFADVAVGANGYDTTAGGQGRVLVYHGSAGGLPAVPDWIADGNSKASEFGKSVATAGDVNGDGFSDLLVGDPTYDNGQTNEGIQRVYLGSGDGLETDGDSWQGGVVDDELGRAVAAAGDVNGDGFNDVIVSAPGAAEFRAYYGSATGPPSTPSWIASNPPAVSFQFGYSLAAAGDANGDGYDDVLVGDPLYTGDVYREGRVALYLGSSTGLAASADRLFVGNSSSVEFGRSVASAGDVNGDGYSDVLVGAPGYFFGDGAVFVYHGSASGPDSSTPSTTIQGSGNSLGSAVASAGDFNGDGYSDVLVCGSGDRRAYVYPGSATGVQLTPWTLQPDSSALGCSSVAAAADVNADGYADVVFGDHTANRVYAFYGSASGPSPNPDWVVLAGQAGSHFGTVASAGDVDNDGYSDLLIGAGWWSGVGTNSGQAYLYLGSSTGLQGSPAWSAGGAMAYAFFGESLFTAGDVNGDGFSDVVVGEWGWDSVSADLGRFHIFLGGGGDGLDRIPRQQRPGSTSQPPIAALGRSPNNDSFRLRSRARSAAGRARLQVEYEVRPWADAFQAQGTHLSNELLSSAPAADGSRINFSSTVGGLTPGNRYKWRLRFRSSSPYFPWTPWLHLQGNGVEEWDVRTGCTLATWYLDADGDTYGSAANPLTTCESNPSGYVANNADCNDSDPNVNPGAPEMSCDAIDNDCTPATPDAPDADADGHDVCSSTDPGDSDGLLADCDDVDGDVWARPGEARDLMLSRSGSVATLQWSNPLETGTAPGFEYHDVLRSAWKNGFAPGTLGGSECVATNLGVTTATDADVPTSGNVYYYLVRTENDCGSGSMGSQSDGGSRGGIACF